MRKSNEWRLSLLASAIICCNAAWITSALLFALAALPALSQASLRVSNSAMKLISQLEQTWRLRSIGHLIYDLPAFGNDSSGRFRQVAVQQAFSTPHFFGNTVIVTTSKRSKEMQGCAGWSSVEKKKTPLIFVSVIRAHGATTLMDLSVTEFCKSILY